MPEYSAAGPGGFPDGATASPDGATPSADGAGGRTGRPAGDHKWSLPARLLVTGGLLPVGIAVILAAENSFTAAIGEFFGPLMVTFMISIVIVTWLATGRGQR